VKLLVKRLLPKVVRQGVREWRALPSEARLAWRKAAWKRLARGEDITSLPAELPSNPLVLFVCYGNIFRSPVAEALMRRAAALRPGSPVRVASAGLLERSGKESPAEAQEVALELGVSLSDHRSATLSAEMVARADLVVIMDRRNEALMLTRFPKVAGKMVLLGAFDPLPSPDGAVIVDPYAHGTEAVRRVFNRIDRAVTRLHGALTLGFGHARSLPRWKRTVRQALSSSALEHAWRPFARDAIAIFMLHRFEDRDRGIHGHSPAVLASHLEYLRRNGYHIASLDDVVAAARGGTPMHPRTVVFTVDDGHGDFARIGAPVFERYDVPATLFLATGFLNGECWLWYDAVEYLMGGLSHGELRLPMGEPELSFVWSNPIERAQVRYRIVEGLKVMPTEQAERAVRALINQCGNALPARPVDAFAPMTWDEVQHWSAKGMRFGSHTRTHPILSRATAERSAREISDSWAELHARVGGASRIFAYPNGLPSDFGEREAAQLRSLGALGAVAAVGGHASATSIRNHPFAITRIPYSDDVEAVRQAISGAERLKSLLRAGGE